jgi:drug/metabolite transporter (DMT)-like permease
LDLYYFGNGFFITSIKKISAFTQNLTLNLEPVYGIILAFFVYHENKDLSNTFYVGFALIFIAVIIQMLRVIKLKNINCLNNFCLIVHPPNLVFVHLEQ